jgi:hypothetical protein
MPPRTAAVPTRATSRSSNGAAARHRGCIAAQASSEASASEASHRRGCSAAACHCRGRVWLSHQVCSSSVSTSGGRSRSLSACSVTGTSASGGIGAQHSGMIGARLVNDCAAKRAAGRSALPIVARGQPGPPFGCADASWRSSASTDCWGNITTETASASAEPTCSWYPRPGAATAVTAPSPCVYRARS